MTGRSPATGPVAVRTVGRPVVLVAGMPGAGRSTLAARLSIELHLPLFSKDIVKEAMADHLPHDVVARHGSGRSRSGRTAADRPVR